MNKLKKKVLRPTCKTCKAKEDVPKVYRCFDKKECPFGYEVKTG